MSLMGSLYLGVSGLQTGQNALNTTAHNMSNIDTVGYTRQQVQQGTRFYNTIGTAAISKKQIGLGVNYSQVKQVRDYFLDRTYRRESGRSAFYDATVAAVEEIEDLFQELYGEAFATSIENLWKSVQDLAEDPSNPVDQGVFIQRCNEFVTRAQAVYTGLCEYQGNLNYKIGQQVETINAYGNRIAELNTKILAIESGQIEKANDLKDERNLLIDELSAMGSIDLRTDVLGNVLIKFEGVDFVKSDSANEISLYTDPETGFYIPYWKQFASKTTVGGAEVLNIESAEVFDLDQVISTDRDTDLGSLKAMMFARGDKQATFKDLEDADYYNEHISQSMIMNAQGEFDRLVHEVALAVNKVFADAAAAAKAEQPDTEYMQDADGNPYAIFKTKIDSMDPDDFTIENLIINGELKQAPSLLGFMKDDGKVDQEAADALKAIFTDVEIKLNPNVETTTNFINFYNNLVSLTANMGYVFKGISENQQITVDNTAAAREQVHGVSSDEELSNMIMFQNAYNASSRYINVISEMLDHILSTLGR